MIFGTPGGHRASNIIMSILLIVIGIIGVLYSVLVS